MIVLKTTFGEKVALDNGTFSVPESAVLQKLLNTLAKMYPVMGVPPDPDAALLMNVQPYAPAMELVSDDFTPDAIPDDPTRPPKIY